MSILNIRVIGHFEFDGYVRSIKDSSVSSWSLLYINIKLKIFDLKLTNKFKQTDDEKAGFSRLRIAGL